jgi:hypothetical protein
MLFQIINRYHRLFEKQKMRIYHNLLFLIVGLLCCFNIQGQSVESVKREMRKKNKPQKAYPDFFGFQYRPLIPIDAFGAGPLFISGKDDVHNATIKQKFSFSAGGVMRIGLTPRLAIETGINFTRRNYETEYFVPDSGLVAQTQIRNISYDLPLNLLIYVKINNTLYINASFGNSFLFFPLNTATQTNTLPHNFITETEKRRWIQMALNANTGIEFRTETNGIFYLGASFHRPFTPLYNVRTTYKYINDPNAGLGTLMGTFFSLDLKYFFPKIKSNGAPIKAGLVDQ